MDRLATAAHGLSRRRFLQGSAALAGLGLVSGCGGVPPQAQPPKVRRIGMLEGSDALDETQFARTAIACANSATSRARIS